MAVTSEVFVLQLSMKGVSNEIPLKDELRGKSTALSVLD